MSLEQDTAEALRAFTQLIDAQTSFSATAARRINDLQAAVDSLDRRVKELEARVA